MSKSIFATALCGLLLTSGQNLFSAGLSLDDGGKNFIRNSELNWEGKALTDWKVKELSLVSKGGENELTLARKGSISGAVSQVIDVSAYEGKQLFFTFEAKVFGGVRPWFDVRSLDGKLSEVAIGVKMEPTDVLGELDRYGWYYDFRYGWPVNSDLTHLFRRDWQRIGTVFTVPKGVKSISLQMMPKPAKYGLIERRENPARMGEVTFRNPVMAPVPEARVISTDRWKQENLGTDAFFYLSYLYNQQQILLTELQARLWRLERWEKWSKEKDVSPQLAKIRLSLDDIQAALRGLREYYHERVAGELSKLDLTKQSEKYPTADASGALIDIGGRRAFYVSLYIQDLIDGGFQLESASARELESGSLAIKAKLEEMEKEVLESLKATKDSTLEGLSYAKLPTELPESGLCPPILFATGNTASPLRIYKDLKVDLFSKNYPVSTFDDQGLVEDTSLPAVLKRYGLKQISCLFTPVHGLFAVSEKFLDENKGRWKEFLREDEAGLAPIHARNLKTGKRDVLKLKLDEFVPEAGKSYILPINPLSPRGWDILTQRMAMVRKHALLPENRDTLAAIELSAEPTGIVGVTSDPYTRKVFLSFLQDHVGGIEKVNQWYGTKLASMEALLDSKQGDLPEALQFQRDRWEQEFRMRKDSEIYRALQDETGLENMAFLHRNNDMYFSDFAWVRSKLKDNFVNYHAGWDRTYGYYLGRALGRDHITGEDHPALPTGLKERHTPELAKANFFKAIWGYAAWGTKSIQIWRPYRENAFHSVASLESDYTMINENWAILPLMKDYTRALGRVLDGDVQQPRAAYLQLEQQGHVTWYTPSIYTTNQFLRREQIAYGYVFEEALEEGKQDLDQYKLIILPPSLFVSQARQEELWRWVQNGGILLTFGPVGLHDKKSLPSSWLMDRAFGKAEYRLVGSSEQLRRPHQEGLWTVRWEKGQPANVKTTKVAEELFLPRSVEGLFEKKWNSFDYVAPLKGNIEAGLLIDQLVTATCGKGKVVMVPREVLPNAYHDALAEAIGGQELSICKVSEPSFSVMQRRAKDDPSSDEYVMVQNEDEWLGRRSVTVTLPGSYAQIHDISDLQHAVPVGATVTGGKTSFDLSLEPGEIATIRLRKPSPL